MMAKVCPEDEGSVRRSARKRRSPGEWWKEFSIEMEATGGRIVPARQDNSSDRTEREILSSPCPEGAQLILREQPVQSSHLPGGDDKVPHVDSPPKRRSFRNESIKTDENVANKQDTGKADSGTGKKAITKAQPHKSHPSFNDCALGQEDHPTHDRNQESPARGAIHTGSNSSQSSRSSSYGSLVTKPCSPPGHPETISDASLRTTNPNSFSASARKNTDVPEPSKSFRIQLNKESHVDVDTSRMETDQEMRCEKNQIGTTGTKADTSHQGMDENDGMEGYEDEQPFASELVLVARENDSEKREYRTPQTSKRLFSRNPTDEVGQRHRYFSKIRAPRKKRSKTHSPSYSFSLCSRRESPDILESVQKAYGNQQTSEGQKRNRSRQMQRRALVAKRSTLVYNTVDTYVGTMKVAVSISLNKTTMGEVVLLPRSATGPRRALTGDEFYVVRQGYVECDIGFTSVTLFAGDHLGIPAGQSFEMRNPSASKSELFFFSPRSSIS